MTPLRDGAVIQRNKPVHVWGFAVSGTEVTVTFGDQTAKTIVNEFDQWRFELDPMPASAEGRLLTVYMERCHNVRLAPAADFLMPVAMAG